MAKVNLSLINPNFLNEAGDYLIQNGFNLEIERSTFYFLKENIGVLVKGDSVDFLEMNEGEELNRSRRLEPILQVSNISHIDDLFNWMLLFHIAGVVPLGNFIREVRKAGIDPMKELVKHFKCTEDRHAVPENY